MISVIIPTYNGAELLRKSLETWTEQTIPISEYEIIVVDNNSQEDIRSILEQLSSHNTRYFLEKTPGATAARHRGVRESHGEYLVFADNDGLYNPECLEEIIKTYEQFPQIEAVACKIDVKWIDGEQPEWIVPYLYMLGQLDYGPKPLAKQELYLNGGLMSVRKDTFERLGGFNPDLVGPYLIGDGDTGFVKKLHTNNSLIGWAPKAHMWHMQQVKKHGSTRGVALHCYNNGIADSYALYRHHNFQMTVAMWKYLLTKMIIWLKWHAKYTFQRDRNTYFKLQTHTGELRFFFLLLKPGIRRLIKTK